MKVAALSGFLQTCLGPASAPLSTHRVWASWLARPSACLPSPRISGSFDDNLPNNSFTPLILYVIRNPAEHGRFPCFILFIRTRSRETYRTADLTKSKTFWKTYKQTFEELQEKLNPWSVVGLRHCKTVTRKTRSEDKTFLRMRPPLKMDIQQPSMGLSTPYRAKNRCYISPC